MGREAAKRREQRAKTQARKELLREGKVGQQADQKITVTSFQGHEGPIPSPAVLAAYGDVSPDLPQQIILWAEQEGDHRRSEERRALEAEIEDVRSIRKIITRSQRFGLTLGVLTIAAGPLIVWLSDSWVGEGGGAGLSLMGLASLVWGPHAIRTSGSESEGST